MSQFGVAKKAVIRQLDPGDRTQAVNLLSRAFHDDPLMDYLTEDLLTREECRLAVAAIMDYSIAIREQLDWPILGLWVGAELRGVAVLSLPEGDKSPAPLNHQRAEILSSLGARGAKRMEQYDEITEEQRPQAPHIYLGVLGVDPTAQGQGYGKQLVDAVQEASDMLPQSSGVYLDTENPKNVSFYKRCGYIVRSHHRLERLRIWCMHRSSRKMMQLDVRGTQIDGGH